MEFELNEKQIAYLIRIRHLRTRFILKAISTLFLLPLFIITLFCFGDGFPEFTWVAWKEQFSGLLSVLSIMMLILMLPFVIAYLIRLYPLQKDINSNMGVKVNKQIAFKRHFPITNQYFFFFEENFIPNIKVDAHTYKHYSVGDYFSIKMTKRSKVVFEDYDRFEIV